MHNKIVILTYFYEDMVGFSIYSYRINLLKELGEVIVVSNIKSAKDKLKLSDAEFVCFGSKFNGTRRLILYLLRSWFLYLRIRPSFVFLMHAQLSLFRYFFRGRGKFIIFWNVHLSQVFGMHSNRHPRIVGRLVDALNCFLRNACYRGASLCSVIMPVGESLADELIKKGIDADKVKLVYQGVDDIFIYPFPEKNIDLSAPLKLLYTGSLNQERGRDIIINGLALAIAKGRKVNLTLIGCRQEEKDIINEATENLGMRDKIVIIDRVPGEKIPYYMHNADIGINLWEINPYFCMNPPTKLFEYMVAGLPVIVNDIETHNLYVKNGVTGFIISYDAKSFARTIEYICENKQVLLSMSLNSRKESDKYRWVYQKKIMREIFEKYLC